jgi:Holliday junction resolvasome RuvABC endonuclease subunit
MNAPGGPAFLAVDPSLTATGLAVTGPTGPVWVTTITTKPQPVPAARHRAILRPIFAVADQYRGNCHAIVEGRILPRANTGETGTGRASTALDLAELRGVLLYGLYVRGVPVAQPHPAHLKKYATGRHNASKEDMRVAADRHLRGLHECANNNEADALWLLVMLLHRHGKPVIDRTVLQAATLDKVEWPTLNGRP